MDDAEVARLAHEYVQARRRALETVKERVVNKDGWSTRPIRDPELIAAARCARERLERCILLGVR